MKRQAKISKCRRYRYALWRWWADGPQVLFLMFNPSTADHRRDDPTLKRCIRFARVWHFGRLAVANLFAYRTPSPHVLTQAKAPVGRYNARWIRHLVNESQLVIVAWGNGGSFRRRDKTVMGLLTAAKCLGITKKRAPRHPLYVPIGTLPVDFPPREQRPRQTGP